MPWRATRDPYAIWVSEVMLQQTRVDTVRAYYGEFLRRFPTVHALAGASQDAVLGAWSGLGYYRRARLLHAGAQDVMARFDGVLPRDPAALRSIPGIGPYTAGAIAAIAYDVPAPVVDGNVARVFSRMRAVAEEKQQPATARHHWSLADEVISHGSPRVIAQAMMELGATVCVPTNPACGGCPVRGQCVSLERGLVEKIPAPKRRAKSPEIRWDAAVVRWGTKLLFERRPDRGVLRGMWTLPLVERPRRRDAPTYAKYLGVPVASLAPFAQEIKHVFTHRVWFVQPVLVKTSRRPRLGDGPTSRLWLSPGERPAEGGVPTLTEKILEQLGWDL